MSKVIGNYPKKQTKTSFQKNSLKKQKTKTKKISISRRSQNLILEIFIKKIQFFNFHSKSNHIQLYLFIKIQKFFSNFFLNFFSNFNNTKTKLNNTILITQN